MVNAILNKCEAVVSHCIHYFTGLGQQREVLLKSNQLCSLLNEAKNNNKSVSMRILDSDLYTTFMVHCIFIVM